MEPDDYLIWLYLKVEDIFTEIVGDTRLRARGFAPSLSCLAPQFSGVYYKKLQEVNLWNIYTTLTPELRRESDKKCGDSQESIAKLAKRY